MQLAVTFITALRDYSTCFGCFMHPSSGVQQLYMQPLAQVHVGRPPSYVAEYKRFPALPDFLSSGGSGKGSTQPREVN